MTRMVQGVVARLIAALMLASALPAAAGLASGFFASPVAVLADEEDDEGEEEYEDDVEDEEEGEDEDDAEHEDDEDDDRDAEEGPGGEVVIVAPALTFRVDITCTPLTEQRRSECVFTGVSDSGEVAVHRVIVPAEAVCADLVRDEPDSDATLTAPAGALTLILRGTVTTFGEAAYWVETSAGIFPAPGPALVCEEMSTLSADVSEQKGAIFVQAFACQETPAADADWYARCPKPAEQLSFAVEPAAGSKGFDDRTETTDGDGQTTFGLMPPGRYELTQVDGNWCHAESDSVDERGLVVVEAGERATVWVFQCDPASAPHTSTPVP